MIRFTLASACVTAALATPAVQAQVVLNANMWLPPTHPTSATLVPLCEDMAKATSGRVKCNILSKAVVSPVQTFDAVKNGVADISYIVDGYTPGRFQMSKMAEMPFLGNAADSISVAYHRTYEKFLKKADEHKGVKVLAVATHGPGQLFTKKPINSLEDLKGLKIRTGGGLVNDVIKDLGAVGMFKAAPEVYELMAGGIIDGFVFAKESVHVLKLIPLFTHNTAFPGGLYNVTFTYLMNEAKWAQISKQDQAALEKLFGEHLALRNGKTWEVVDAQGVAEMKKAGIVISTPSPKFVAEVAAKIKHLEQDWIKSANAKGIDGAAALKFFRAEIAALEKRS